MPPKALTADDERDVRRRFIANARLRQELLDVEVQIADLMQLRADLRAQIAACDTIRLAEHYGCSHQVILSTIRPRSDDALAA